MTGEEWHIALESTHEPVRTHLPNFRDAAVQSVLGRAKALSAQWAL